MKNEIINNPNISYIGKFLEHYQRKMNKLSKVELNKELEGIYLNNCINFLMTEYENISEKQKYASDKRCITELIANIVVNGWFIEDTIISNFKKHNIKVEKNGSDSNRMLSQKNFTTDPDLMANGKKVEVQCFQYNTIILKTGKLETCIKQNANILLLDSNTNKYCLLTPSDIKNIMNTYNEETIYTFKKGYVIPSEDLAFDSFESIVEKIK